MKFKRVNKIKSCLVIEPVGLFLQLIDSSQDPRSLQEYQAGELKQLSFTHDGTKFIVMIQIQIQGLLKQLRKLSKYYELVIYTILPSQIMDEIYSLDDSFQDLISHTLCLDHLVHYNELVCKDLGLLVENRTINLFSEEDEDG